MRTWCACGALRRGAEAAQLGPAVSLRARDLQIGHSLGCADAKIAQPHEEIAYCTSLTNYASYCVLWQDACAQAMAVVAAGQLEKLTVRHLLDLTAALCLACRHNLVKINSRLSRCLEAPELSAPCCRTEQAACAACAAARVYSAPRRRRRARVELTQRRRAA